MIRRPPRSTLFPTRRSSDLDARLLVAFFGGCFIVYAVGRLAAFAIFRMDGAAQSVFAMGGIFANNVRSEEHTSELQSRLHLVCRLLLEKKNFNHHRRVLVHH